MSGIFFTNHKRIIFRVILCIFLLTTMTTLGFAHPCRCTVHPTEGFIVNCSFSKLTSLPYLPRDITELHVSNTSLSTVPPGLFDKLVGLKKLSITGNPFHCDCKIQYLRNWVLKNKEVVKEEPVCVSPEVVTQKAISELSDEFFSASCSKPRCTNGVYLVITGVVLLCVIALLVYTLRLAKESTITLYIDERHAFLETHSLRSRKPKHKRKLSLLNKQDPLERPLLNMELLPQVHMLHKKHNIKIKET